MPQMVVWPFIARTMVEAGFFVKIAVLVSLSHPFGRPLLPGDTDISAASPDAAKILEIFRLRAKLAESAGRGPVLFGWGRKAAIEERAKKVARMLFFIKHGMRTKTYDQFVASFSNPGDAPDVLQRYSRDAHFVMHISASCWYSAQVNFPHDADDNGFITLQGGGDDFGVFITAAPENDRATVELHLAFDQKAGRDAKAIVRALEVMPHWTHAEEIEGGLGLEY